MKIVIGIFMLVLGFAAFYGCYYDNKETLYPDTGSGTCDTTNVTFQTKISGIMGSYCTSCHGNAVAASYGGGVKLQDYADVKANINKVYGAVNHLSGYSAMPKGGGKLDDCKLKQISIWKTNGMAN